MRCGSTDLVEVFRGMVGGRIRTEYYHKMKMTNNIGVGALLCEVSKDRNVFFKVWAVLHCVVPVVIYYWWTFFWL